MTNKDDTSKVVKLRQPATSVAAGAAVDGAITPKSLLNMTDIEQDMFLQQLRERRLRVVELLRQTAIAKQRATGVAVLMKLEKKQDQVERQLERTTKALEKLEELIHDMRALTLQHTDIDIANIKSSS
jgi:predicted transcriptional regulator